MPDDARLIEIKDRAASRFLALPGVTAVGIGGRERAGRPTGELVIKVFVQRKRPAAELAAGELIPASFEGVGTDLVEMGEQDLLGNPPPPPGKPEVPDMDTDTARRRPLLGGCAVMADLTWVGDGTLACLLKHRTDPSKVYALTNWHIIGDGDGGARSVVGATKVGQPTNQDSVTKCCSSIVGRYAGGALDTTRDAALIQLNPGTEWQADILDIGAVRGIHKITQAEAATQTYPVRKRGIRSRLTGGTVQAINATTNVAGVSVTNTILVKPHPNDGVPGGTQIFFAQHGDSGSALVNAAAEVVGLVFSAVLRPGQPGRGNATAVAIDVVISRFQAVEGIPVEVATAAVPGIVNTVPGAAAVAVPAELAQALAGHRAAEAVSAPAETAQAPAAARWPPGVDPPPPALFAGLQRDLDRSTAGRHLIRLWLSHQRELLDLVNRNRRVTVAWHRGGGPALFQMLIRMLSRPELALPHTLDGEPLPERLDRLHQVFARFASPALRRDLDQARRLLPDPSGRTYPQIIDALGAS
ncbi:hypothetical protein [Rhizohabitans arisaemae]|uniref:hypothetical protein n=1 Tax=Rhizohabitans arisaemae TaxID=2720610 RepID=UPI0024B1FB3D|nr:hypothetical protein [Rhizohabitans arisaemae]